MNFIELTVDGHKELLKLDNIQKITPLFEDAMNRKMASQGAAIYYMSESCPPTIVSESLSQIKQIVDSMASVGS